MDGTRFEGAESRLEGDDKLGPWEARVAALAKEFPYPPSPALVISDGRARSGERRQAPALRPAWAATIVVLAIAFALLAVPQVRAAVVRIFQLGVVRVFVTEPLPQGLESQPPESRRQQPALTTEPILVQIPVTATPFIGPPPTALPGTAEASTAAAPAEATGAPASLAGLAGQTTLEEAQQLVPFPIALPSYPAGLGAPDYVFVQDHAAPVLILAWSDPKAKGGVGLSLWMFLSGTAIDKFQPETVAETSVGDRRALWTQGEHMLYMRNGDIAAQRLVLGNTLIWEQKDITFRLETFLPLEEAVKVAESVR